MELALDPTPCPAVGVSYGAQIPALTGFECQASAGPIPGLAVGAGPRQPCHMPQQSPSAPPAAAQEAASTQRPTTAPAAAAVHYPHGSACRLRSDPQALAAHSPRSFPPPPPAPGPPAPAPTPTSEKPLSGPDRRVPHPPQARAGHGPDDGRRGRGGCGVHGAGQIRFAEAPRDSGSSGPRLAEAGHDGVSDGGVRQQRLPRGGGGGERGSEESGGERGCGSGRRAEAAECGGSDDRGLACGAGSDQTVDISDGPAGGAVVEQDGGAGGSGWVQCVSRTTGRRFYYHAATKQSCWRLPQ